MSLWTAVLLALRRRFGGGADSSSPRRGRGSAPLMRTAPVLPRPVVAVTQSPADSPDAGPAQVSDRENRTTSLTLAIMGLDASSDGAQRLEALLGKQHGVMRAYTSPFTRLAYIDYDAEQVNEAEIEAAIVAGGWSVDPGAKRFPWRRY